MGSMTFLVNTFDCIVMTDTLAYADDYKKSLSEVARVLKPRGRASFGIIYVLGETDWRGGKIKRDDAITALACMDIDIDLINSVDNINKIGHK